MGALPNHEPIRKGLKRITNSIIPRTVRNESATAPQIGKRHEETVTQPAGMHGSEDSAVAVGTD